MFSAYDFKNIEKQYIIAGDRLECSPYSVSANGRYGVVEA